MTSEHALTLDHVPSSVIVLGGGVIGCEFASVWRSFGADVTIVEALPRLVAAEDEAVSKVLERAFKKRGIAFHVGTPFESVEHTDDGVRVTVSGGQTIDAELLLVAVGRGPTTSGLGYDEQGVVMDRGFVLTDERLRTNLEGVYAVGDIVPGLQLAHRGFRRASSSPRRSPASLRPRSTRPRSRGSPTATPRSRRSAWTRRPPGRRTGTTRSRR